MDYKADRKLLTKFLEGDPKVKLERIERAPSTAPQKKEAITSEKKPKIKKPKGTITERIRSYMKIE